MVIETVELIDSYTAYMAQVPDTVRIFRVIWVMMRHLIRGLHIPIEAWTLDTNCELVKGNNFITSACDMDTFRLRLNKEYIVISLIGITCQIEQRRMTPLTPRRDADHV